MPNLPVATCGIRLDDLNGLTEGCESIEADASVFGELVGAEVHVKTSDGSKIICVYADGEWLLRHDHAVVQ